MVWWPLGANLGPLGAILGPVEATLGLVGVVFGSLGAVLGPLGELLGLSSGLLVLCWRGLGASRGTLVEVFCRSLSLDRFWVRFGVDLGYQKGAEMRL